MFFRRENTDDLRDATLRGPVVGEGVLLADAEDARRGLPRMRDIGQQKW